MDKYNPAFPTAIDRTFNDDFEIPEKQVGSFCGDV